MLKTKENKAVSKIIKFGREYFKQGSGLTLQHRLMNKLKGTFTFSQCVLAKEATVKSSFLLYAYL